MGILKHTHLAQSVGKGDVDVITRRKCRHLTWRRELMFFFTQPKSRNTILAIIITTYKRNYRLPNTSVLTLAEYDSRILCDM